MDDVEYPVELFEQLLPLVYHHAPRQMTLQQAEMLALRLTMAVVRGELVENSDRAREWFERVGAHVVEE